MTVFNHSEGRDTDHSPHAGYREKFGARCHSAAFLVTADVFSLNGTIESNAESAGNFVEEPRTEA